MSTPKDAPYKLAQRAQAKPRLVATSAFIREGGLQLRRLPLVGGGHETQLLTREGKPSQSGFMRRALAKLRKLVSNSNNGPAKSGGKGK